VQDALPSGGRAWYLRPPGTSLDEKPNSTGDSPHHEARAIDLLILSIVVSAGNHRLSPGFTMAETILDVIAFGTHPDDVELTCSGTLIKLGRMKYRIGVVSLTTGELGTRGDRQTRLREFVRAARIMGAEVHQILNLPDGWLTNTPGQKMEVVHAVRRYRPRIVFAPYWEDRHPDHAAASRLIQEACFISGLQKIDTGQPAHRPFRIIYYPSRFEFKPSFIVDISETHEIKMQAIKAYSSQFHNPDDDLDQGPETNISHPGFLEAVETRNRQYGSYIGVRYGEPFLVREPMRLDDPIAFFGPEYRKSFV
jgi:bacillithiol biosynthesis deacetylase BshB1